VKPFGCPACAGDDAAAAWEAIRGRRDSLAEDSHFGVSLGACACGQLHVVVFAERIDWAGGEDDQTWLALPVTAEEVELLRSLPEDRLEAAIVGLGSARRFLVRSFPTGGSLGTWWRDGGLVIPRHD
jgi:hypothetical protein